jgi:hypothetical protein
VQIAVLEGISVFHQGHVFVENLSGPRNGGLIALQNERVVFQASFNTQIINKKSDILLAGPEERLDAAADSDVLSHSARRGEGANSIAFSITIADGLPEAQATIVPV